MDLGEDLHCVVLGAAILDDQNHFFYAFNSLWSRSMHHGRTLVIAFTLIKVHRLGLPLHARRWTCSLVYLKAGVLHEV